MISNIFSFCKWVQLCTSSGDGHRELTPLLISGAFKATTDAQKSL